MQPEQIITADLLDILFADRNKMYGAYTLRRGYNKRLTKALVVTGAIVGLALLGYYSSGKTPDNSNDSIKSTTVVLKPIDQPKEPEPPVPPPPPPPPPPPKPIATIRDLIPVIVPDNKADVEPPPTVDELDTRAISDITRDGDPDFGITPPPESVKKGIITAPARPDEGENGIAIIVNIQSNYPGGLNAWRRFLQRTIKYPDDAQKNDIEGTVLIQFIVDKEGNVSDVQAVSGPEELRMEAVRVISKSGKWTPAILNGRTVKSYKKQQVTFALANE